jgi:FMN phosphatase YigB (HAD superfamily)
MAKRLFERLKADQWFFDMDGTVYSQIDGVYERVLACYQEIVKERYRIDDPKDATNKLFELKREHDVPLFWAGMVADGVPFEEIARRQAAAVSGVDLGIAPSSIRENNIRAAKGRRTILTNSPEPYARVILATLGVDHLFAALIGVESMGQGFVYKPQREAFAPLLEARRAGQQVVFVDDELPNIFAVEELDVGIVTVFVSPDPRLQARAPQYWVASLD